MRPVWWWLALGAGAALLGWGAQVLEIPGGWFVGAAVAAVTAGLVYPRHPKLPRPALLAAQAAIGTMIGGNIRPESISALAAFSPEVAGVIVITLAVSLVSGLLLGKLGVLGRETAILGSLPGGASAMTLLSLEAGADPRVVALMQYLRLFVVVAATSLVAHLMVHTGAALPPPPAVLFRWIDFAGAVVVAVGGVWGGRLVRLPTANFLGPMLLGVVASSFHLFHPVWPLGMPQAASLVLGLYVGLLFDRESLSRSIRLIPVLLVNIAALIIACGLAGWAFAALVGTDVLTGYLSTSPGGADTIALIAMGSGANVGIVFSMQIVRSLVVLFAGPPLAKAILKRMKTQIQTSGGTHEQ